MLQRGYDKIVAGKRVALIEDILNTGGSARDSAQEVERCGGKVIVVSAICNRGGVSAQSLGVPAVTALVNIDMKVLTPKECLEFGPCSRGVPVRTDYGHGKEFLAALAKQQK